MQQDMHRERNRNRLVLLVQFLLICTVVFLKLLTNSTYFLTPDSYYYLQAAQNLLDGKGYTIIFEEKETFCAIWPVGYAALIALVSFLSQFSVEVSSKIVNLLALSGCFFLLYHRFKEKAWFMGLGFMASSLIQLYSNTWSETVFLFFVLGFCFFYSQRSEFLWLIGAFLTRYAGVFLLLPLICQQLAVGNRQSTLGSWRPVFGFRLSVISYLAFIVFYLSYNFYQTHTFTGGHGFWPTESFVIRLDRGIKGIEEELVFFTMRDWNLKNMMLSNAARWFIYGVAFLQCLIGGLIVWRVGGFLWKKRSDIRHIINEMTKNTLFIFGVCYLLFTMVVYLTDASIESLYFRRLAPSSLLLTLALLDWISNQKEIFKAIKWFFVAFFLLSLLHGIDFTLFLR